MRIPQFTAEASLYARSEEYRATVGAAPQSGVVPQFCYGNPETGYTCCDCYYGWCWCHHILRHVLM